MLYSFAFREMLPKINLRLSGNLRHTRSRQNCDDEMMSLQLSITEDSLTCKKEKSKLTNESNRHTLTVHSNKTSVTKLYKKLRNKVLTVIIDLLLKCLCYDDFL